MKKWTILNKLKNQKSKIKIDQIVKILLANRGIKTKKEVKEFLNPPDPYKLTAKDLGINPKQVAGAVKRIKMAISKKEKIIIYGDYDTDGVCATAILWETLHKLGAEVMPFIPKREEGYGMRIERIDEFAKDKIGLIITADHGIVALKQVEHAQKIGIDVIVTDHHLLGAKIPKAKAIVHTTKLSGSGVSWFLATRLGKPGLDLVTIGTVVDVMPLIGVNRCLVYHGLSEVRKTKRLGLRQLYKAAGIIPENIGTYEIGFIIGPRLNAAGRIEDPMESLRLLCTKDVEKAALLARKIDQQNRERQLLTEQMTIHARDLWLTQDGKGKLIFVSHQSYEEGIVGLIAGKLVDEFYRPAIIVAQGEKYSRASARSINGFNIVEAIRICADILGPHGGHALAAGFTVETARIEELKTRLSQFTERELDEEKLTPVLKIDLELDFSDINLELFENLKKLEPFGFANPEPVFLSRNLTITDAKVVGGDGKHLKLRVACPLSLVTFDAIGFGMGSIFQELSPDEELDLVYTLTCDQWNNEKRLQLKIKDLRASDGERI
ncbi:MAG: single-stranded-DNA-specific exonuclease RecJ [Patescibacteria group bacterium]